MPNGLPQLAGNIANLIQTVQLDVSGFGLLLGAQVQRVWGIYGANAYGADAEVLTGYSSVIGFQFQGDERVPVYPIENGGFASYNKVRIPSSFKLTYIVNGGAAQINAFLALCDTLRSDTNLYDVVTPNFTYPNCNFVHYDYQQRGGENGGKGTGISMLKVDVWLSEIRASATAQFTSTGGQASSTDTGSPDLQAQQNGATVQTIGTATLATPGSQVAYDQLAGQISAPPPQGTGS